MGIPILVRWHLYIESGPRRIWNINALCKWHKYSKFFRILYISLKICVSWDRWGDGGMMMIPVGVEWSWGQWLQVCIYQKCSTMHSHNGLKISPYIYTLIFKPYIYISSIYIFKPYIYIHQNLAILITEGQEVSSKITRSNLSLFWYWCCPGKRAFSFHPGVKLGHDVGVFIDTLLLV